MCTNHEDTKIRLLILSQKQTTIIITMTAPPKKPTDNFVCRPEARPPDPPLPETVGEEKKKIRRRGKAIVKPQEDGTTTNTGSDGTKSKRRFRGSLEDRTCPHCGRIFSSQLGCNYHISTSFYPICLDPVFLCGGGGQPFAHVFFFAFLGPWFPRTRTMSTQNTWSVSYRIQMLLEEEVVVGVVPPEQQIRIHAGWEFWNQVRNSLLNLVSYKL